MGDGRDLNFVQGHAHVLPGRQVARSLNPSWLQRVARWVTSQRFSRFKNGGVAKKYIYILWLKKDLTYIKATTSISSLGSAA
jgi:hypothetical protein